ncbi:hypothetical protein QL285_070029 [Trifolium repens]|nr:hypothetical protein QL285_070029 [Trifolium repens]
MKKVREAEPKRAEPRLCNLVHSLSELHLARASSAVMLLLLLVAVSFIPSFQSCCWEELWLLNWNYRQQSNGNQFWAEAGCAASLQQGAASLQQGAAPPCEIHFHPW